LGKHKAKLNSDVALAVASDLDSLEKIDAFMKVVNSRRWVLVCDYEYYESVESSSLLIDGW
jgi:hypothetical protein